ncbi:MAG: flavin reductase family protein, partial [Thermoanaerobaculia bacterium]
RYEAEKFREAGLTPVASETVAAPRVLECPVQMEGFVHDHRPFGKNVSAVAFEIHITRLHVDESLLVAGSAEGEKPRIDPERWQPLLMSFCRFFGMGGEVHPSRLAESDFMKIVARGTAAAPSAALTERSGAAAG